MKKVFNSFITVSSLLSMVYLANVGCVSEQLPTPIIEVPDTVSFSSDIIPIFEASCAVIGCHVSGGQPPNLGSDQAYISLTFFGYIDTENPPESILMQKIDGGSMTKYATDQDRALILKWIEQDALNN